MSRVCTICRHPHCADIDESIRLSRPNSILKQEYNVSVSALRRHKAHIVHKDADDAADGVEIGEIQRLRKHAEKDLGHSDPKIRHMARVELKSLHELEARLGQDSEQEHQLLARNPIIMAWLTQLHDVMCQECQGKIRAMPPGGVPAEK